MNLATLADRNLEEFGEYERLVFDEARLTNRELHDSSSRLARALVDLGLEPGERVVVIMPNCPEVLVSYPAVWRAGLAVIPVLFLLESRELRFILENSGASAVITSPDQLAKVREASEGTAVRHIVLVGEAAPGTLCFDELCRDRESLVEAVERAPSDLAVLLYTSGTTGVPKGVMQTHGNIRAASLNSLNSGRKTRPDDVGLLVLPLAHSFGLSVLVSGYQTGGKAVLMRWFEPAQTLRLLEQHRVRAMAGVPAMFIALLNHPARADHDTSRMERWLVGAAPMPTEQLRRFEEQFGGMMYVGYGLTEACPGIAVEREGMTRKAGSTGVAMHGVDVLIVDDDGNQLATGEKGEVIARGENISPGYYGLQEASGVSFRDGWLYTGDIGYLDEDGYLFIVERKKDLIIRGGFNVYPKDVEEVIHELEGVVECAVVGVPHERLGEEVMAYVVLSRDADLTERSIVDHCQTQLAKYKTPRHVVLLAALPRNNIGKIMKRELRERATRDATQQSSPQG